MKSFIYCRRWFCLLLFSGIVQTSMAEESSALILNQASGPLISADSLLILARDYSRKLWSLSTNVEIAQYRLSASGWFPNPEFRLSDVNTRYYLDDYRELEMGLRFRFPNLGELGEEKQQARVRLWEEKLDQIRYRQSLTAKTRRDIADVVLQDRLVELTDKKMALLNRRINTIEQMTRTGGRSIVYYTKAKMIRSDAANDYARAIQNQREARRQLVKRTGIAMDAVIDTVGLPELTLTLDELILKAGLLRPETELVEQQVKLAESRNRMEWLQLMPWINFVEMSYHREEKFDEDWGEFRMGVELPLFNWNIGNIKATNLAVKKREFKLEAVRETLDEEVRAAYTVYRDYLLDWKNYKKDADLLISEASHVVEQAKIFETLRPDEVLEMELTIIETQQMLAKKKHDVTHALIDLYFMAGIESPDQLN